MDNPEWDRDIAWDKSREWPSRYVTWLLEMVKADLQQEQFSRDCWDKLCDRGISLQQLWRVVLDPETYIARYWYGGSNRVGFWHPETWLFVVWKPRRGPSPSRIMTCFVKRNGVEYMQLFPSFREIRGPRGQDGDEPT